MTSRALSCLLLVTALVVGPACDSSSPSGPRGRFITVTAAPDVIAPGETSAIGITARRPDGNPAAGETVTMATNFGAVDPRTLTLDADGLGMATLQAPAQEGEANVAASIDAGGEVSMGVTTVMVVEPAQLVAEPQSLEIMHTRDESPCPNEIGTAALSVDGTGDLAFRIEPDLPTWLELSADEGDVPSDVVFSYNCEGMGEIQVLGHTVTFVGIDPDTGTDLGDPVEVDVQVSIVPGIS